MTSVDVFPAKPSRFLLPGPAGQLEVMTDTPDNPKGAVLICHPNPVQAGTMDNKVVTTIAKAFQLLGWATLRFNYRGVGKSEGVCEGRQHSEAGEIADAQFLYEWLSHTLRDIPIALAGFSFGAYVAAVLANREVPHQLLSIAPTVDRAPYGDLLDIQCPWLIVQGDQDELISHLDVKTFAESSPLSIQYIEMLGASHFFHGRLIELRELLCQHLRT